MACKAEHGIPERSGNPLETSKNQELVMRLAGRHPGSAPPFLDREDALALVLLAAVQGAADLLPGVQAALDVAGGQQDQG